MKFILLNMIILFIWFDISANENGKYELESVSFFGNSNFSESELSEVISLRESPNSISQYLNDLIGLGEEAVYFDSLSLPEEEYKLKSFYFNNGFFHATISSTYFLDSANYESFVVFEIVEGKGNNLDNIKILDLMILEIIIIHLFGKWLKWIRVNIIHTLKYQVSISILLTTSEITATCFPNLIVLLFISIP